MESLRKRAIKCIVVCAVLAGAAMLIPQSAQAADKKFVIKNGVLIRYKGSNKKITIPKNVKRIKREAFWECDNLETVTVPGNVRKIDDEAFRCRNLKKVVMKNGVTTIGSYAFYECEKLNSITIPKSVKKIGDEAFEETPWLAKKSRQRKDRLVIINHILIDGKNAKGKVTIPKGVTEIAGSAFRFNSKLSGVTIPSTVKTVGAGAFTYTNIKKITFPKSVKSIGEGALGLCGKLKEVTILNPKAKIMWDNDDTRGTIFDDLPHIEGFAGNKIIIKGYKNSTAAKLVKHINGLGNKSAHKRYKKAVFKAVK